MVSAGNSEGTGRGEATWPKDWPGLEFLTRCGKMPLRFFLNQTGNMHLPAGNSRQGRGHPVGEFPF